VWTGRCTWFQVPTQSSWVSAVTPLLSSAEVDGSLRREPQVDADSTQMNRLGCRIELSVRAGRCRDAWLPDQDWGSIPWRTVYLIYGPRETGRGMIRLPLVIRASRRKDPQLLGEDFPPVDVRFQIFVLTGFLVHSDRIDSLVLKHLLIICISIMQGKRVPHSLATAYPGLVPAHTRHGTGCRPSLLHFN